MKPVQILDCTLRDGSYVTEFQFTVRDTALIAAALENCGLELIEIGHGLGLHANERGKGAAAADDLAYMQAAGNTLRRAKWGVFFIPEIGRECDLRLAADCGAGFVRVGTNVNEVRAAGPYLALAKQLGMLVTMNFMKSYAVSANELACQARQAEDYGADLVYVVDSAGCMLPSQVQQYVGALADAVGIPVGFHGHDNLSLAIANSLAAVEAGAAWVDSTLQGLGRGAGNAATEVLVALLDKLGAQTGIDKFRLMDISRDLILPLLRRKGFDAIDVVSGLAGFHSSFLPQLQEYAKRYAVDLRELILGVCARDQIQAPPETIDAVAKRLRQRGASARSQAAPTVPFAALSWDDRPAPHQKVSQLGELARRLRAASRKAAVASVLNIVACQEPLTAPRVSGFVQEGFGYAIGSVELGAADQMEPTIAATAGEVDLFLVDADLKGHLPASLADIALRYAPAEKVIAYRDNDVWVRAVEHQVVQQLNGLAAACVAIIGADHLSLKLTAALLERGAAVMLTGESVTRLNRIAAALRQLGVRTETLAIEPAAQVAAAEAQILVTFGRRGPAIDPSVIAAAGAEAIIVDAGIGGLTQEALDCAHARRLRVVRPDMRAALAAELKAAADACRLFRQNTGRSTIADVPVVACGLVGRPGEVVVDSITTPTRAIGIADGSGRVIYQPTEQQRDVLATVEGELLRRLARCA